MSSFDNKLREYGESDSYPYHMPGHKRNNIIDKNEFWQKFYDIDITEIDGFDNLHDAKDVILDIERRAARLYGSSETHLLIGGSTVGVLSAISAAVNRGGKLLMQRDSHKSAYHGVFLRALKSEYIYARGVNGVGYNKAVTVDDVKDTLEKNLDADAVFITSPTYEGYTADVKSIADLVHSYNIPLIVDSAHGAHFGRAEYLPENAVLQGADIVIHSLHKTLPSPTMTGLIHINSQLVSADLVKRYLGIYQSSSPSYPLMAGIDRCVNFLEDNKDIWKDFYNQRKDLAKKLTGLSFLKIRDYFTTDGEVEICKLIISGRRGEKLGKELHRRLVDDYMLQPEMSLDTYVLLFLTIGDTKEGYDRLADALIHLDKELSKKEWPIYEDNNIRRLKKVCEIYEALEEPMKWEKIGVATDFVTIYPPGQPILVPGEISN